MSARIVLRSGKVIETTEGISALLRAFKVPDAIGPSGRLGSWVATPDGPAFVMYDAVDALLPQLDVDDPDLGPAP